MAYLLVIVSLFCRAKDNIASELSLRRPVNSVSNEENDLLKPDS